MNVEDFKKREWELFGAPCTPLIADVFAPGPARGFIPIFGLPCEVLCLSKGNYLEWIYDRAQIIAFSEKMLPSLLNDPWGQYERCRQAAKEYADMHDAIIEKDISVLSDSELDVLTHAYVETSTSQFTLNNIIEPISFYFQSRFKDMLLAEGVEEKDIDILMDVYGRSKYPNYVKLCLSEYQAARNEAEVDVVLKKYTYLTNDFLGPKPLTRAYVEELLKQQIHEPKQHLHIGLSSKAGKLLEVLQFIATIQDVRKAETLMIVNGTYFFVAEYAKRLHIPMDVLLYALWDEILDRDIDEKRLRARMEQCAFFWEKDKTEVFEGEESKALSVVIRESVYGKPGEATEIKGICASPGKVRGRAVIVMQPNEFHKVKEGDILFTMMTRPEFLLIMQQAAAFVTDEGGITSHAAIVAREMKKPCIIATKIGTKSVKDGDLVEVDAERGVVRKLR